MFKPKKDSRDLQHIQSTKTYSIVYFIYYQRTVHIKVIPGIHCVYSISYLHLFSILVVARHLDYNCWSSMYDIYATC